MNSRKLLFLFFTVILIWAGISLGVIVYFGMPHEAGEFGDLFGAVNALFTGLTLTGAIYAIVLQSSELKLQREELTLTRRELARTALAQEKSELALSEQVTAMTFNAALAAESAMVQSLVSQLDPKHGLFPGDSNKKQKLKDELVAHHQRITALIEKLDLANSPEEQSE